MKTKKQFKSSQYSGIRQDNLDTYLDNYAWLENPLKIEYLEKSKPIESLPFKQVWVIDNYLPNSIWESWRIYRDGKRSWGRQNKVFRNNEYQHIYWGEGVYINLGESQGDRGSKLKNQYGDGNRVSYALYNHNNPRFLTSTWKENVLSRDQEGYRFPIIDWFIHRLREDFRFNWEYFQYCGFNGQTIGQDGTVHEDTSLDESCLNNLSFLYYDQERWDEDWGGDLIFYNREYHDHNVTGIPEDEEQYEIGRIQYKPNRLVVMNGAITHRHPAPSAEYTKENGFPFRTSMVIRGDKCSLWEKP